MMKVKNSYYTEDQIEILKGELKKGGAYSKIARTYAEKWKRSPGALSQKLYMLKGGTTTKTKELTDEHIKKLITASVYPEGGMNAISAISAEDIQLYREGLIVKKLNSSLIKNGGNISREEVATARKKIYMHNYNQVKKQEKQESQLVISSDLMQLAETLKRITSRKTEIQYHLDALNTLLNNL